jgi:hypothetical protein
MAWHTRQLRDLAIGRHLAPRDLIDDLPDTILAIYGCFFHLCLIFGRN